MMEKISQEEVDKLIKYDKEEIRRILDEGGKVTDAIIREKNKTTTIRKIEPVNGETTSSTIIQNKDEIIINP